MLCCYPEQHDYSDYIELVTGQAHESDEFAFLVQCDQAVFQNLESGWPAHKFWFLGAQRKSRAECVISALRFWGDFDMILDPFENFECKSRDYLAYTVPKQIFYEIQCLMEKSSVSSVVTNLIANIKAQLDQLKALAVDSSLLLEEWVDQVSIICDIERKLFKGYSNCSLGELASCTVFSLSKYNNIEFLTSNIRHFRTWKHVDTENIESRLELCIALGSPVRTNPVNYFIDYYSVFSAFLFSNSKSYLGANANLSALYLFRSFELAVVCLALKKNLIAANVIDKEIVLRWIDPPPRAKQGDSVDGVGRIWYRLRDKKILPASVVAPI